MEIETSERRTKAMEIVNGALGKIRSRYGTGKRDGEHPLAYHNWRHTLGVIWAATKIAELAARRNKISRTDIDIIKVAASYHDIEQGLDRGLNEDASKQMCEQAMKDSKVFLPEEIELAKRMIDATKVSFVDGSIIQSATDEFMTQLLADADLASLGCPTQVFWESSMAVLKEMKNADSPSPADLKEFAKSQLVLLKNHSFYTEEAKESFPHKEANILYIEKLVTLWGS